MKKIILFLCLCWSIPSYAQLYKLNVHIIRNEIGEIGLSIADAEAMIKKIGEDFDGTTAANMIGVPAAMYDTGIQFCPEIIIHEDDDLIYEVHHTLKNTFATPGEMDLFLNFYGDHIASGMIAGRDVTTSNNNASWVTNYRSDNHTATHEIGHSFGAIPFSPFHCVTYNANDVLIDPSCFAHFMVSSASPWDPGPSANYTAPYHFDQTEIAAMQAYLNPPTSGPPSPMVSIPGNCLEYPTADFKVDRKGPPAGTAINFSDLSSTNAISWDWDFGDGTSSTLQNPTHTYANSGIYPVELTVTSADGITSPMTRTNYIHVDPTPLSIPYTEDFDDPDFYSSNTWFVDDGERDCVSIMSGSNTYMWNHSSSVGNFYINGTERIDFVNPQGVAGSGAMSLISQDLHAGYGENIYVNSPDFNLTGVNGCVALSFSLSHIPFNNGYTLMSPPTGNVCECPGNYLNDPAYAGNTFANNFANWDPVCLGNVPSNCLGTHIGEPDCNLLETLKVQYSLDAINWTTIYSKSRDELLTVPGESCAQNLFAPIGEDWWRRECINLPAALYGVPRVRFRFNYQVGEGTNTLLIDNFTIDEKLDLLTDSQPICMQNNGSVTVDACSGTGPYTYQWAMGCPGTTPISNTSNVLSVSTPGFYDVTVTDSNGCTNNVCIEVLQTPPVCIPNNVTICPFECVTIGCLPDPNITYQWSHVETRNIGIVPMYSTTIIDGNTSQICVSPTSTTTYTLDVFDATTNCSASFPVVVTVDQSSNCTPAAANNNCCAPVPATFQCATFGYAYGTEKDEFVGSSNPLHSGTIIQTSDFGFMMTGYSRDAVIGTWADQQIIKVKQDGTLDWVKGVSDVGGFSDLNDVVETYDGGYAFTGGLGLGGVNFTMHVMKTHADGTLMWDKVLHGDFFSTSRSITEAANNDLIVGGYSNYGAESFYVVRLSSTGNVIWRKNYRSTSNSYFSKVIELSNGNIALVGSTLAGGIDGYILVVDAGGTKVWSSNYDLGGAEEFFDVVERNNDLIVVGYTTGIGAGNGDENALIARINKNNGNVSWTNTYELSTGNQNDHFSGVTIVDNNKIVAVGQRTVNTFVGASTYAVVAKVHINGNTQWVKEYGVQYFGTEKGRDVIETAVDNGLAIFGTSKYRNTMNNPTLAGNNFYLVKTDSDGETDGCYFGILPNTSLNTALTEISLAGHTDQLANPIPNFATYSNHSISQYRTDYITEQICYDPCPSNIQQNNGAVKRAAANGAYRKSNDEIQIAPNPTEGRFIASWEGNAEYHSLEIFTTLGEKVMTIPVAGLQSKEIDLSSYPKGIYILNLISESGNKTNKVLIQ